VTKLFNSFDFKLQSILANISTQLGNLHSKDFDKLLEQLEVVASFEIVLEFGLHQ